MNPQQDHFVAFVDRLAADLDAIPRTAEGLAADASLSRHHFERVITAIAGTNLGWDRRATANSARHCSNNLEIPSIE